VSTRSSRVALVDLLPLLLLLVCLPLRAAELTVSAATSLSSAFRELAPMFEAQSAGTRVLFNFAASDALLAQIARGAPVDVFASADEETMDRAEKQKLLVPGSRRTLASNTLVLILPNDSAPGLNTLADLQQPRIKRVALGTPSIAPAGRYARSALEAANVWPGVKPKAIYAQNVRQVLDYVARGEVDAGFVYATDAAIMKDKVRIGFSVPTATRITYPVSAIAVSRNVAEARRFVDFLLSPAAQAVLARHGFGKP